MAQHSIVTDEKILKSINRIAPKVFNDIKGKRFEDWAYYNKNIRHLPEEINPGGHAFAIWPYNTARVWEKDSGAEEKARLEVHLSKEGVVTAVYYPL